MATMTPPRRPITVFNLPNQLTTSRLVLAVVLFGLIHLESWAWCLAVFAVAAFTDWLDGYLARIQGLTSSLGRILDPLVDKVLICGAFIFPHFASVADVRRRARSFSTRRSISECMLPIRAPRCR